MKEATPINKTFTSEISVHENGWTCVHWPQSVSYFGSTKPVKVRGTMNSIEFQATFLPTGDGAQFLPINQKLMKAMNAQMGDTITVHLDERL
ncbi:MAG TPA: DUF1905 domain-containing protein [Candidatus Saccharimonadales bacterium]|nr:DUF1905 domain-containing protein [Candidatus Saccharimonadales bacterium]